MLHRARLYKQANSVKGQDRDEVDGEPPFQIVRYDLLPIFDPVAGGFVSVLQVEIDAKVNDKAKIHQAVEHEKAVKLCLHEANLIRGDECSECEQQNGEHVPSAHELPTWVDRDCIRLRNLLIGYADKNQATPLLAKVFLGVVSSHTLLR